jgi:adenosylmethionine-8-amino-7-oxononanoate aminotransferase
MQSLAEKDHRYLWHPFTQMKDWLTEEPVIIESGEGALVRDIAGREYIDANSSIWTNLHGHRHPKITGAIKAQLDRIAHSSFLGLSNVPAIELAEKLSNLTGLPRVFYSDDGSTATAGDGTARSLSRSPMPTTATQLAPSVSAAFSFSTKRSGR